MSKRRKVELVDTTQYPAIPNSRSVDWNQCILCQESSSEKVICPTTAGYTSLVENLNAFAEHNALPPSISIERLDDGSGLLSTFITRGAKYHKLCRNKYDVQKLNRLLTQSSNTSANCLAESSPNKDCATSPSVMNTRSSGICVDIKTTCLFCDGESTITSKLRSACTKDIGPKIYEQAVRMQDTKLLAKISSTDFIALEVKYHIECYTDFRNKFRKYENQDSNKDGHPYRLTYGFVISELVQYIEDMYMYNSTSPVFRLSDITRLVVNRMKNLGIEADESMIHRTRLKEQLLELIPGLREDKSGRDVLLIFGADVGDAIRAACEYNDVSDGMCLARAARILRRDLFMDYPKFVGSFTNGFGASECVPPSLVHFLQALIGGQNIDNGSPASKSEEAAALTVAQLIRFNSVKRKRLNRPEHIRHSINQETPLPIYIGLMIHSSTRSKSTVEKLNKLGLCISYDRLQQIEATVTNTVCDFYDACGNVVPVGLSEGTFTTAAIDNIDHNPSSTTAADSFHGSSVTVIQHPDCDIPVPYLQMADACWTRTVSGRLPASFTTVPATGNVLCERPIASIVTSGFETGLKPIEQLRPWLDNVESKVCDNTQSEEATFSAYHAKANVKPVTGICNHVLLPLLPDHIQSPATVRHLMDVIMHITNTVNNGQPAVITADQPVYAVAKYIQWKYPNDYGEDKVVMMMGGLHVEMAVQNMLGKWLRGSGWSDMFLKAGVASPCSGVNECRRILYTRKNRAIENIPPSADALFQHCKRASMQARLWQDSLCAKGTKYDPTQWGWMLDAGRYVPVWSSLPEMSEHCAELIRSSCKSVCRNCKCHKSNLSCTKLCACDGMCNKHSTADVLPSEPDLASEECSIDGSDLLWQEVEEDSEVENVLEICFDEADF
jgi:hypothetical protein